MLCFIGAMGILLILRRWRDTRCKYHDKKRELLFFVGGKQDTINLEGKIKNEITMTRSGVCSVL